MDNFVRNLYTTFSNFGLLRSYRWALASIKKKNILKTYAKLNKGKLLEKAVENVQCTLSMTHFNVKTKFIKDHYPLSSTGFLSTSFISKNEDGSYYYTYNPKKIIMYQKSIDSAFNQNRIEDLDLNSIELIKSLRDKRPDLWPTNLASKIFNINPSTIRKECPLTSDSLKLNRLTQKVIRCLSPEDKKRFKYIQIMERNKMINESIGSKTIP